MAEDSYTVEELEKIQKESEQQLRPDQKTVTSVSSKIRQRLHNLPDPANPPLGYDDHKAFDRVFPYINIPSLHPKNHGDTVIFNDPDSPANRLYLGDNLEVLRTLKSESIDLIYIDPPFFSGRNYNVIWGDTNEVRTFEDIWEGGITSYLIWLNARLWEMRRVLKKTGSIYVHCDWHASHYIKAELDKIFGYENYRSEIIWKRSTAHSDSGSLGNIHDTIHFYSKSNQWKWNPEYTNYDADYIENYYRYSDPDGRKWLSRDCSAPGGRGPRYEWKGITRNWRYTRDNMEKLDKQGKLFYTKNGIPRLKQYMDEMPGVPVQSLWIEKELQSINSWHSESIGYPTQKPESIVERIIKMSSSEGDIIADFFIGGGTTTAVAQRLNRHFIGVDSSRVAVSVTLDRLIKLGEKMSGVESNISAKEESFQMGLQTEGITEKVPNIEVSYLGVYPVEKFANLDHEEFINFVLTAYGASRNTGESFIHGFKPPAQQEPLYIGPADPNESIDPKDIQKFFDAIKVKLEPNKMVRAKIIAWRFSREALKYIDILKKYSEKNNLPLDIEAIPLDSKEFRKRILQRMPGVEEAELFLRFSKPPGIGAIKAKRTSKLEYEFEAVDAISTNENGWLVNCQWDFDYQEGHFASDKNYVLSREKKRDSKRGEIFEAALAAKYKFEKSGEYIVACKVQDNLAGETIMDMKVVVN
ncbi:hypothetical protein HYW35_00040 [Candidatus Saccharibacteria bacterium]|nr:hypothetical protein [Candidatus Saccharibacteria bacterium]